MFVYGKLAQAGVFAVSYLAAVASESRLAGSEEIAGARKMSHHLMAKVLTMLSREGIVTGIRGPSGGYRLSRPPGRISLFDVVSAFEDVKERVACPFGPDWGGSGSPCPVHDLFCDMHQSAIDRLKAETFAQFEVRTEEGSSARR